MAGVTPHPARLPNREAQSHFDRKVLRPTFAWQDSTAEEHAIAFTVAKMMDEDMLAETQKALQDALAQGTDFATFKARLKPYLMARGWWGKQLMGDPQDGEIKLVQLGSTRRLRTIYHTNLHSAYAAGQWARIERNKKAFPYLKYIPSDAAFPREEHRRFYGMILPVDDPFWQTHMPPNGWGCRCNVRALTRAQAEKEGISPSPQLEDVEHINTRTGEVEHYPEGVDPSFAHNPGDRLGALLQLAEEKHGAPFAQKLKDELDALYASPPTAGGHFTDSISIIREGERLYTRYKDLMDDYINKKEPHLGILEIMKREGVVIDGEVTAYSSRAETAEELIESLKCYPKAWVDASNKMGRVLVEDGIHRAWHLTPDDAAAFIAAMRKKALPLWDDKEYEQFRWACKGRNPTLQQGDGLIKNNLSFGSKRYIISTHIHEFAHRLQQAMPELDGHFARLWRERTAGETVQSMIAMTGNNQYEDYERGKRDDFPSPYYGRMYGDENDPQPREMMSMTFEALLGGDPRKFAELAAKPDFLHFGLALLVRYTP